VPCPSVSTTESANSVDRCGPDGVQWYWQLAIRGGEWPRRWSGNHRLRAESRDLVKTRTPLTANSTNSLALAA